MTMTMTPPKSKSEFVAYEAARELSARLRARREEMELRQEDVAAQTGLSQQDISASERLNPMTSMRVYNFLRLLQFYGIKPNEAASILSLYP